MVELSDQLVAQRRFALADQLVRAACSVPNNVAEGQGRATTPDRRHYLVQARGSLYELETQLEILQRTGIACDEGVRGLIAKVEAGLTKMIGNLSTSDAPPPL